MSCWHARIFGRVQGVSFRYYTEQEAVRLGIDGWVRNCPDGSVEALICGEERAVSAIKQWLQQGPAHASIERIEFNEASAIAIEAGFSIRY